MGRLSSELMKALPSLSKAVFSQPTDKTGTVKITVRPMLIRGRTVYQAESFRDSKAFHRNLTDSELLTVCDEELDGKFRQVLIVTGEESSQYILKQSGGYRKSASSPGVPMPGGGVGHNREKEYILSEGENIPALVDLGVFTRDLRVVRAKYDKFRQINRFVELVDQQFREDGRSEISILDFGCGKSYLTFILYYYFTVKKGMRTKIIGYDLKADVVENCNNIAKKYGYVGLEFHVADVTKDVLAQEHIDMVVTLHACDTATDYALYYALSRKVKYIFSVPCCQHEVELSIKKGGELDVFMDSGIIKERMCALLTDAVRAAVLEDRGYRVDMIEFIDFEHSPKNIMIRATYSGRTRDAACTRARQLQTRYGFDHTLLRLTSEE